MPNPRDEYIKSLARGMQEFFNFLVSLFRPHLLDHAIILFVRKKSEDFERDQLGSDMVGIADIKRMTKIEERSELERVLQDIVDIGRLECFVKRETDFIDDLFNDNSSGEYARVYFISELSDEKFKKLFFRATKIGL